MQDYIKRSMLNWINNKLATINENASDYNGGMYTALTMRKLGIKGSSTDREFLSNALECSLFSLNNAVRDSAAQPNDAHKRSMVVFYNGEVDATNQMLLAYDQIKTASDVLDYVITQIRETKDDVRIEELARAVKTILGEEVDEYLPVYAQQKGVYHEYVAR